MPETTQRANRREHHDSSDDTAQTLARKNEALARALGPVDRSVSIAGRFQATTAEINPLIVRAEKALAALRLGVSAEIEIHRQDDNFTSLRFGKIDKEWCLSAVIGNDCEDVGFWDVKRLQTASRETRLLALAALPILEKQLVAIAEKQMTDAEATVSAASAYVAALEARAK